MQGRDPGGAGGGRTRAAASGGALQVPRVAGDAGQGAVADRLPAEFRGRRLAEENSAAFPKPRDRRCILVPGTFPVDGARAAKRRPTLGEQNVLHRHRHAVERGEGRTFPPARFGCARLRRRRLAIDQAKGVDLGIERLDPMEQRLRRFDRR